MNTCLICHSDAHLTHQAMGRWLASFSNLCGIVLISERPQRLFKRIRREIERVGMLRFVDVLAYRVYNRLFLAGRDAAWEAGKLAEICTRYPQIHASVPVLVTHSPNSEEAEQFLRKRRPDVMVARCKTLLREGIFSIPAFGTWVMHPGICPEYRNAHGCFWALANGEPENVGMTLLRVDAGIDTGPIYGYYTYDFDEVKETPSMIHHRVVLENLDQLQSRLIEIYEGRAQPIDTSGRRSATWGQPWLTRYLQWKWKARRSRA
jgi:folate-dependent phosphoribosylglycinamide formyltransferase PurN